MTDATDNNDYGLASVSGYIEEELVEMGATKGKDYTVMDLARLAMDQLRVNAINQLADQIESLRFDMLSR